MSKSTKLSAIDLIDNMETQSFSCKTCSLELEVTPTGVEATDSSAVTGAAKYEMLNKIVSELPLLERENLEFRLPPLEPLDLCRSLWLAVCSAGPSLQ